jgi:hypothetical protein
MSIYRSRSIVIENTSAAMWYQLFVDRMRTRNFECVQIIRFVLYAAATYIGSSASQDVDIFAA